MSYKIQFIPHAERELSKLSLDAQVRIVNAIETLSEDPRKPGVVKLKGEDDLYRIKVGDYRIIFTIDGVKLIVLIVKIAHRREVYR